MRKWLPAAPIVIALALAAAAYPALPSAVRPAFERVFPLGSAGDEMPRAAVALLFPGVMIAVWALLAGLAKVRGTKGGALPEHIAASAVARFEPTYHVIVFAVVTLLLLLHVAILAAALAWPAWTIQAVGVALGVGLVLVGNLMPRVRPNWIVGVRTPATLADSELWMRTHRYFGGLLMLAGVVVAVVGYVAPQWMMVALAAGVLVAAILAHWRASRAAGSAAVVAAVAALMLPLEARAQTAETPFDVSRAGLTLPGSLVMPAAQRPDVLVIIAGSGPTDRNGNGPLVQTDLYKQLARELADSGYATVRYDKRGIGPGAMTIDHTQLSVDDYVSDARAFVDSLRSDGRFGRVFLMGHSEGTMHAVLAANRGAPVAGVILLSATGRPLARVLHDQFALQVDSVTVARVDSAFAQFIRGETPVNPPPAAAPVLVPHYRKMIASMAAYDPVAEVKALRRPLLVITGSTDLQTNRKDFEALRAARGDAKSVLIPGANHVFKATESLDPAVQQPTYRDPGLPIVRDLVPTVVAWLKAVK